MSEVKIKQSSSSANKSPSYLAELVQKFEMWTEIKDPMIEEAMKDLSGDLWAEIRKFEAQIYAFIEGIESLENEIEVSLQLPGSNEVKKANVVMAKYLKDYVRERVREMWRDIIEHQKVGVDKFSIVIRKHLDSPK